MLRPRYYLHNFQTLVDLVSQLYADLLTDEEADWADCFNRLPEPAQCLYVRLLSRSGSTFRLGKLRYPEIAALPAAAEALAAAGLVDCQPPAEPAELIARFTRAELQRLCDLPAAASHTRAALVAQLIEDTSAWPSRQTALQTADQWLTLVGRSIHELFMLCFFGNERQDLSTFVRRDLGTLRLVNYPLDGAARAFSTRAQLDAHVCLMHGRRRTEDLASLSAEDIMAAVAALPDVAATALNDTADAHLQRRVERERNRLARQLERLEHLPEALAIYQSTRRTPARERQVRVLIRLQRAAEALAVCEAMQAEPRDATETQFAAMQLPSLRRLCGRPAVRTRRFRPRTTRLTLQQRDARVERASVGFYSRSGHCYHVENSLVCGVLGLFIWDIVFQSLPGAFFNPFQEAPADFYEPGFHTSRATALAQRFRELHDPAGFRQRVFVTFEREHGLCNPLVRWPSLHEKLLALALERIPANHWQVLFERVLADLRHNTAGLPDLVWFPSGGGYEFIEIKGPGDALQKNQRRWLQFFDEQGIPGRVVHIRWAVTEAPAREADSVPAAVSPGVSVDEWAGSTFHRPA